MTLKTKHGFSVLIVWLSLIGNIYSQRTETKGNLLRIDFTKSSIDLSDTLWDWTNIDYLKGQSCSRIFYSDSTQYLLINAYDENPKLPWVYVYLYNTKKKTTKLLISHQPPLDPMDYYLYGTPLVETTPYGNWIFFGFWNSAAFLNNDSIVQVSSYNDYSLIHSAGEIEGKNLLVLKSNSDYSFKYCLEELSDPSSLKITNEIQMIDSDGSSGYANPLKIYNLQDSLYLFVEDMSNYLYLTSFDGSNLIFIKRLRPKGEIITLPGLAQWRYVNKNLFYIENKNVVVEKFDVDSIDFTDKKTFLNDYGETCNFSNDNRFFADIKNDSLFVYSLANQKLINSFSLGTVEYRNQIVVDSPYVYLHQIKTTTAVIEKHNIPTKMILYQNFPNPFNPSTTINYDIPKAGKVELKIYDTLGQEITTLVDEYKDAGEYNATFTANKSFASGVYIYKLKANNYLEVKKMLLLK